MEFVGVKMDKQKHIALVAHDNMKKELIQWVKDNRDELKKTFFYVVQALQQS